MKLLQHWFILFGESKRSGRKNLLWIGLLVCIHTELLHAQAWSETDSLWLAGILAGKDTLKLNPEFQHAIRSGTLINLGEPVGKMQMAPSRLPLAKDFSEYITGRKSTSDTDSTKRRVALKDLPPAVFMRYGLDKPLPFNGIYQQAYTPSSRPTGRPATGISLSFNDLLQAGFSRSYRQRMHNRKHATAWKTYNDLPTPDVYRKQKQFRNAHPELIFRPDTFAARPILSTRPTSSTSGAPNEAAVHLTGSLSEIQGYKVLRETDSLFVGKSENQKNIRPNGSYTEGLNNRERTQPENPYLERPNHPEAPLSNPPSPKRSGDRELTLPNGSYPRKP